ncbi:MAG TPA: SDR family NAD(P)-dependent oxidoreductase, partial [Candidatus Latescibacteria bacterium]|nr:SDR family NAD(P)-dependent oxidoreductase [Candidatus Latescibacterota bacterium]
KVVLISGANRSIGRATAQGLYAAGYGLSLGARDSDRFAEMIERWDETRILTHRYDAEDYETHRFWVRSWACPASTVSRKWPGRGKHPPLSAAKTAAG